jgi:hypothetical protein
MYTCHVTSCLALKRGTTFVCISHPLCYTPHPSKVSRVDAIILLVSGFAVLLLVPYCYRKRDFSPCFSEATLQM